MHEAVSQPNAAFSRRTGPDAGWLIRQDRRWLSAAFALGIAGRLLSGWHAPLWFDESYSGVIATQPTSGLWLSWCLHELTGPIYYGLLWITAHLFGGSDGGLRLPSLIASLVVAPLVAWRGHPDRDTRLIWAGLIALWVPLFDFATFARPYALLFLLCTMQAIAFLSLLRDPRLGRAALWAGLSALAILTHYHALVPSALEGLAYLCLCRRGAMRTWPAALCFVPVTAWMAIHLPFVLAITSPEASWYGVSGIGLIAAIPSILFGINSTSADCLAATMAIVSIACRGKHAAAADTAGSARGDRALILCTAIGLCFVFGMAMIRPSFTPRYLTPLMPGFIFALACWIKAISRSFPHARLGAMLFLALLATPAIAGEIRHGGQGFRYVFSFQKATDWLLRRKATGLVFLWDNPTARASDPRRLAEVANFSARRAGHPLDVIGATPTMREDVSAYLVHAANAVPGRAILWIYDRNVDHTLANRQPPHIGEIDPRWQCRDFGGGSFGIITCVRQQG